MGPVRLPVLCKKRWARKERFTEVCKYHHLILMKQWPNAKKKKTFPCVRFLETDGMYFRNVWKQKREVVHMGHLAECNSMQKKNEHRKAFRNTLLKKLKAHFIHISHSTTFSVKNYEEKKITFIGTYHFSIFHFLSIKHSLHYEHIITEKEIGLHFSSASIAAPISACWILSNKTKVTHTLKTFFKNKWYCYKLFRLIFMFGT